MIPLNAIDAISPAITRVRHLMFAQRRWQTAFKLGFLALLAETGASAGFNFPTNLSGQQHPHLPAAIVGAFVFFAVLFGLFILCVGLAFFYIGSRLQFVLFDLILRQDTLVAPSWRLFGRVTWRWIVIRLLLLLAVVVCFLPLLVPVIIQFVHAMPAAGNAEPNFGPFLAVILGFIVTLLLFLLVAFLVFNTVRDFGLPAILLENTGIGDTLRRALQPFRIQFGQTLLYLLMRLVLGIAGTLAAEIGLALVGLISAIPPGILVAAIYFAQRGHGVGGKLLFVFSMILLGAIWLGWMFILASIALGAVQIFLVSYSIYFLAGRYPPLGAILDAQQPPQIYHPPQAAYIPPPAAPAPGL